MLLTRAEASDFRETSLHADVMAFLSSLEARKDKRFHLTTFGTSPQGRALPLVVLSCNGVTSPEQARQSGRPVVLIMDGIHPGEVEGKEATLALLRDVLDGSQGDWLEHLTLVVVPLFNPDGNDALDPSNRRLDVEHLKGQRGPVVGTRTQSHGINLNRDYMRQSAPEMRLLTSEVLVKWAPDITIDNHATNGSVHRMQMTVDIPHTVESGRAEPIMLMRERLVPQVIEAVGRRGFTSGWYGNFVEDERVLDSETTANPDAPVGEGWVTYPHHPRFGSNYRGLTNRLDLLLECYSYLPFEERVRVASAWQIETLTWVAQHADEVKQIVESSRMPPTSVAIRYQLEAHPGLIEIPTFSPRTFDGKPTSVQVRHLARFVGSRKVIRPTAYIVPPQLAQHLRQHGLTVHPVEGEADVEIARVISIETERSRAILEGTAGELEVTWREERRALPAGWSAVSTEKPLGAIAVYLCEPESDDGAVENALIEVPQLGEDFPVWRVR